MRKVVIVGGVAGGMSAATRLRRLEPDTRITVLERSGYVSYANCGLPYYLGQVIKDEKELLLQTPKSLALRFGIDVRVLSEVTTIDREKKVVGVRNLDSGESYELEYDQLILSPGATPVVPPIPGVGRAFTLRTVEDVQRITMALAQTPRHAVVIGGGFIGVEAAENLRHRGIATSLIEALDQVLAPIDVEMVAPVHEELRRHGVDLHLGSGVAEVTESEVVLANGDRLPADLVILAIGVRPDTSLAQAADLQVGTRGGIAIDEYCRTSDHNIYAVGDAVEKTDAFDGEATLIPLANIANRQGRVVADHIAGRPVRPVRNLGTAIVKVFDLTVASTGWNEKRLRAMGREYLAVHTHPGDHAGYYPGSTQISMKLLFDPHTGDILGAQGVGSAGVDKRIDVIATAIRGGITAPELADLELAYAPPFGSAKDPVNMLGYIAENLWSGFTQNVQWHEVPALLENGWTLLDVRSPSEFERGHIPGALNISVDGLRERLDEVPKKNLIVYCQVGMRGHTATVLLREKGFTAMNLDGGWRTWAVTPIAAH